MRKALLVAAFSFVLVAQTQDASAASACNGWYGGSGCQSNRYHDFWGETLVDLLFFSVYHRIGCYDDYDNTLDGREFDYWSSVDACRQGSWDNPASRGFDYLDWQFAGSLSDALAQRTAAGNDLGGCTHDGSNDGCGCGYNILTTCNSDCGILQFTRQYHWDLGILSPCF